MEAGWQHCSHDQAWATPAEGFASLARESRAGQAADIAARALARKSRARAILANHRAWRLLRGHAW